MKGLTKQQQQRFDELAKAFELHSRDPQNHSPLSAEESKEFSELGGIRMAHKVEQIMNDYHNK